MSAKIRSNMSSSNMRATRVSEMRWEVVQKLSFETPFLIILSQSMFARSRLIIDSCHNHSTIISLRAWTRMYSHDSHDTPFREKQFFLSLFLTNTRSRPSATWKIKEWCRLDRRMALILRMSDSQHACTARPASIDRCLYWHANI